MINIVSDTLAPLPPHRSRIQKLGHTHTQQTAQRGKIIALKHVELTRIINRPLL